MTNKHSNSGLAHNPELLGRMTREEKELRDWIRWVTCDLPDNEERKYAFKQLTALRARLSLAEEVVEAVKNVDASMGMENFIAQKRILQAALRAYDAGKEEG